MRRWRAVSVNRWILTGSVHESVPTVWRRRVTATTRGFLGMCDAVMGLARTSHGYLTDLTDGMVRAVRLEREGRT